MQPIPVGDVQLSGRGVVQQIGAGQHARGKGPAILRLWSLCHDTQCGIASRRDHKTHKSRTGDAQLLKSLCVEQLLLGRSDQGRKGVDEGAGLGLVCAELNEQMSRRFASMAAKNVALQVVEHGQLGRVG